MLFLQDVLREIEQERLLPEWPRIEPLCAANRAEAERILSTSPPHAILLDLSKWTRRDRAPRPSAECRLPRGRTGDSAAGAG